jgi:formylglycine-generating enzyme
MKNKGVFLAAILTAVLGFSGTVWAGCPSVDVTGDCRVDLADLAALAAQWLSDGLPPDMVSLPAGVFARGNAFSGEGSSDELPVITLSLDAFMIDRYDVTNQQYCDFLNNAKGLGLIEVRADNLVYAFGGSNAYCDTSASSIYSGISYTGGVFTVAAYRGNHPMVCVSWWGAIAYANWRSQQTGWEACYDLSTDALDPAKHGFRLPTEAEWEYAARGGLASKRYPWGDSIAANQANYWASGDPWETGGFPLTTPVGFYSGALQKRNNFHWPDATTGYQTVNGFNDYSLADMAGNVGQWCNDWYLDIYYAYSPYYNPPGPTPLYPPYPSSYRVFRGGNWGDYEANCRVACRNYGLPSSRNFGLGFRLVLDFK